MNKSIERILGVSPYSRGFGFILLEGGERLVDFGVVTVRPWNLTTVRRRITMIAARQQPTLIVTAKSSREGRRAKGVRFAVDSASKRVGAKMTTTDARDLALALDYRNQRELCAQLALRFGQLAPLVPPARRPWEAHDARIRIFVALAAALVADDLDKHRCRR